MDKPFIITTVHRGVFFGYADPGALLESVTETKQATLHNARCAIRFGTTKGFLELADTGPTPDSRIGATAPTIHLQDVTVVIAVTAEAEAKWKAA